MQNEPATVHPPLYLVTAVTTCESCGADLPVAALLSPHVSKTPGEVCVFSSILELPDIVRDYIQKRVPTFRLESSRLTQSAYYVNTCPHCLASCDDFFLHDEPGAPFFPTSEQEAALLKIETIPLTQPVLIRASYGMGIGDLILENAQKTGSGDAGHTSSQQEMT